MLVPRVTVARSSEKHLFRRQVKTQNHIIPMGDKSPKSNQKKSTQKQSKASSAAAGKKAAVLSKQSAAKKK